MQWKRMSLDEYAVFQKASGSKLVRVGSTWWARVAPFFFRPLNPFLLMDPDRCTYPLTSLIGGVQHAVTDRSQANSRMRFFIYENLQDYDLGMLNCKRRSETRQSLNHFTARRITDHAYLVKQGHPLYREFYERTGYRYRIERVTHRGFERWAHALLSHPGVVVIGAYHRDTLAAVDISFRLGGVIFDDMFFSNNASQRMQVTSFMVHTLRQAAAATDATWIYRGAPSTSINLDLSKRIRGCRLMTLPARFQANPLALTLIRRCYKTQYRRLLGVDIENSNSVRAPKEAELVASR